MTASLLAALLWMPATGSAQMVLTQTNATGDGIMVFPTPTAGLPNPTETPVTGLPTLRRPHGLTCVSPTTCVAGDFRGTFSSDPNDQRIFIVDVPSATVTGTLQTAGKYSGGGTLAVNRARTHVLGANTGQPSVVPNPGLAVIATPVTPASSVTFLPLPDYSDSPSTSSIVFDATDRAYVCYSTGIAVLEPPYTAVAFTITLPTPPGNRCPSIAVTPDGGKLLVPDSTRGDVQGSVRIFTAPFGPQSPFETLPIPGSTGPTGIQNLAGIATTPDGSKALLVNNNGGKVWAISAPFNSASVVEQLPLPSQFATTGFEDVTFTLDGQFAVATGQGDAHPFVLFLQAPFTAAGVTGYAVPINPARGNGAARFVPPPPPVCGPNNPVLLAPFTLGAGNPTATPVNPLAAAILPVSRSVQVGCPATAFVSVINGGAEAATNVAVAPAIGVPGSFLYQTTDPNTNALTGTANTPATIGPGQVQSFVIAFTPTAPFGPTDVPFSFAGDNTFPVIPQAGLNTLLLSASSFPVPDIVALAATPTNDGIVNIPGASSTGAFAVATVNLGLGSSITVSADTGTATLPINLFLCRTNPGTGQCLSPPALSVDTTIAGGETPTFTILVQGTGVLVPFDPAGSRVFVRFKDGSNATRGSTSVAVRTQ